MARAGFGPNRNPRMMIPHLPLRLILKASICKFHDFLFDSQFISATFLHCFGLLIRNQAKRRGTEHLQLMGADDNNKHNVYRQERDKIEGFSWDEHICSNTAVNG